MSNIATSSDVRSARISQVGYFLRWLFVVGVILFLMYLTSDATYLGSNSNLVSIVMIAIAIALLINVVIPRLGGLGLDITNIGGVYSLFYFLYYLLPILPLLWLGTLPERNEIAITVVLVVSYISWYIGLRSAKAAGAATPTFSHSRRAIDILLLICIFAILLVGYRYLIRLSEGVFFNQARYYEVELSVDASIYEVFAQSIELPTILLLALVTKFGYNAISQVGKRMFWGYSIALIALYVLSSQTRPAVTAVVFTVIGYQLLRNQKVKILQIALISVVLLAMVLIIQGVRVSSARAYSTAENQLAYALENTFDNALEGLTERAADISDRVLARSTGGIVYLSDIMDATQVTGSYLNGNGILQSLYAVIPRFIWADKPLVLSSNMVVRQLLGLPLVDATLTSNARFFAEGGWIGLILGQFAFGWLLGKLRNQAVLTGSIGFWILFCFALSQAVQIELDLVIGMINALRNAVFVCVLYYGLLWLFPAKETQTDAIPETSGLASAELVPANQTAR